VRGFGRSPSRLSSPRPIAAPTDEEIAAGATAPPGFIHLPRGVRSCATSKSKGCRWSSSAKAFSAWGRPLRNSCALIGRELSWQRRIPPFRSRPTPLLEPKVVVNQRCRCGDIPTINGLSSLHKALPWALHQPRAGQRCAPQSQLPTLDPKREGRGSCQPLCNREIFDSPQHSHHRPLITSRQFFRAPRRIAFKIGDHDDWNLRARRREPPPLRRRHCSIRPFRARTRSPWTT
jgi:hypothetical protein